MSALGGGPDKPRSYFRFWPRGDILNERGLCATHPLNQCVYVSEHMKITNLTALEREDWHTDPPNMTATRSHSKHLSAMVAMKAHFATDSITFLNEDQHVSGVVAKRCRHQVHVTGKLAMPDQGWAERASKGKIGIKN